MKEKELENKIRVQVKNELPMVFCQDAEDEIVRLALDIAKEYADWKIKECLPEKKRWDGTSYDLTLLEGWNACIDQILLSIKKNEDLR